MADDLTDFPDGGHMTLVRRYSPGLTRRQFDILRFCKNNETKLLVTSEYRQAIALKRWGLLEQNPTAPALFRTTEAGLTIVNHWESAGWTK